MLNPVFRKQIQKDLKRLQKQGKDMRKFKAVVHQLLTGQPLPPRYRDHALTGNWAGFRDCHIEPDWLLIYQITSTELILVRSGYHSDLF